MVLSAASSDRNDKYDKIELMKLTNLRGRAGQSLIEVIIGLAIGAILVGSAAFVIASILRSNLTLQRGQSASNLSQELMNKIRSFVAADWQNIYSLTKGTSTQYWLNASGSTFIAVQGKEGVIDNDVTSGLVAHWKFDEYEGTTSTTTYDSSGNNLIGTIGSLVTRASSTCKVGNCLKVGRIYNSNNGAVNIGSSTLYDTATFTIAMWLKPISIDSLGANANIIMGRETYLTNGFRFGISGNGTVSFWTTQSGGTLTLTSEKAVSTDRFYHIAVTFSSSTGTIYIDGENSGSASGSYIIPSNIKMYVNGGIGGTTSSDAYVDDVRWYNRALSADEVKQIYRSNIYTRYFSVENVCRTNDSSSTIVATCGGGNIEDPATQKVTVYVRWPEGTNQPRIAELTLSDYFTRWQNVAFHQTDWSGGSGFDGPVKDLSTNRYSTSSNIGAPPWGYLYIKDVGIRAPTDGLVAYWPFDEGVGTSTADTSGNGNNGILSNGSSWVAGKVGNALNFNSVSLTVPNSASLQITGSSTFVFVAKFANPTGCNCSRNFFYKGSASTTPREYRLRLASGDTLGAYGVPSNEWGFFGTSYNGSSYVDWLVPQNNGLEADGSSWKLVVIVKPPSGGGNFYSDRANLEYSNGTNVTAVSSTNDLKFEALGLGSPMIIDEFRIYNRALSEKEIKDIYDSIFNP